MIYRDKGEGNLAGIDFCDKYINTQIFTNPTEYSYTVIGMDTVSKE